jgi:hypothetical protein
MSEPMINDMTRGRIKSRMFREREAAYRAADDIERLSRCLDLESAELTVILSEAERLAKTAVDLTRHIAALRALEGVYELLGGSES